MPLERTRTDVRAVGVPIVLPVYAQGFDRHYTERHNNQTALWRDCCTVHGYDRLIVVVPIRRYISGNKLLYMWYSGGPRGGAADNK